MKVAGMIPSMVASRNDQIGGEATPAATLTTQNGKTGIRRRLST